MDKHAFETARRPRAASTSRPPLTQRSTQFVWVTLLVMMLAVLIVKHEQRAIRHPAADVDTSTRSTSPRSMGVRIDVNRATIRELSLLPGIGPKLAERIRSDRQRRGEFRGVRDLSRVPGIGPRTIAKIRSLVHAGGPMTNQLSQSDQ